MTDWSPNGAPFAISDRASASARLERSYRRLVRFYPRSFRRESTEEIIAVLLATARGNQRRPTPLEAADLLRGAFRMWLGLSKAPRAILYAVRLMYLGALAEAALIATLLVTRGSIQRAGQAAVLRSLGRQGDTQRIAAEAASVINAELAADIVVALLAIATWLLLAWANGRGYAAARPVAIIACALYAAVVALGLTNRDMTYAPAATSISCLLLAIGVAATGLLLAKQSWAYYDKQLATQ